MCSTKGIAVQLVLIPLHTLVSHHEVVMFPLCGCGCEVECALLKMTQFAYIFFV